LRDEETEINRTTLSQVQESGTTLLEQVSQRTTGATESSPDQEILIRVTTEERGDMMRSMTGEAETEELVEELMMMEAGGGELMTGPRGAGDHLIR